MTTARVPSVIPATEACRLLGIEERRLKQLIRDHVLSVAEDEAGARGVPAEMIVKGQNGWVPLPDLQGTLTLLLIQGGRGRQVQAELHPRVRGVDPLAAGTRRVRKALDQLPRGHDKAARAAGPSGNAQIVHAFQCAPRAAPQPRQASREATRAFRSGSTSAANQGFFFIHIWLRGEGWTSGKYVGR